MNTVDIQLQRIDQVPRPLGSRTQPCSNVSFLVKPVGTQKARTNKAANKNMIGIQAVWRNDRCCTIKKVVMRAEFASTPKLRKRDEAFASPI